MDIAGEAARLVTALTGVEVDEKLEILQIMAEVERLNTSRIFVTLRTFLAGCMSGLLWRLLGNIFVSPKKRS